MEISVFLQYYNDLCIYFVINHKSELSKNLEK